MTPQQAAEWHVPYFPSVEECDEEDNRGDFKYHMSKELDDAPPDPTE